MNFKKSFLARTLTILLFVFLPYSSRAYTTSGNWKELLLDLSSVRVFGDQELKKFDRELDQAVLKKQTNFLATSPAYVNLMSLRSMEETLGHVILEKRRNHPSSWIEFQKNLSGFSNSSLNPALEGLQFVSIDLSNPLGNSEESKLLQRFASKFSKQLAVTRAQLLAENPLFEKIVDREKFAPGTGLYGSISGRSYPLNTYSLTFDDGPRKATTPLIFENLKRAGILASFFWLAQNVGGNQDLIDQAKASDYLINNHSFTHRDDFGSKLSDADLEHEVGDAQRVLTKAYGFAPKFFRCPFGAGVYDDRVRTKIASYGLIHVLWNIDSLDWKDKDPASILDRVQKQMALEKHGIILMHDIHPQTVEASKRLLGYAETLKGTAGELHFETVAQFVENWNSGN